MDVSHKSISSRGGGKYCARIYDSLPECIRRINNQKLRLYRSELLARELSVKDAACWSTLLSSERSRYDAGIGMRLSTEALE
jgi:hypothetical protein